MSRAGLETPRAGDRALARRARSSLGDELGYPLIVRPSFTLGGAGAGSPARGPSSTRVASRSLAASPVTEILVEESVAGWKEFELEVMRDGADNAVDRLLDRERRPDGRAHRRLDHGGAGA